MQRQPVQARNAAVPAVLTLVSLAALGAVLIGGLSVTGGAQPRTNKITGTYTLAGGSFAANKSCGTDAVHDGTPVAVRDNAGKVLGVGRLASGTGVKAEGDTAKASQCTFTFVVLKVPATETYAVRVGSAQPQVFARADLAASNWEIDLI